MMNFHSESVDFVTDFRVNLSMDLLGSSFPLNEGQKTHREIHSKIHDKIPAKSTHVVKNGVGKSSLQEEGARSSDSKTTWAPIRCLFESLPPCLANKI